MKFRVSPELSTMWRQGLSKYYLQNSVIHIANGLGPALSRKNCSRELTLAWRIEITCIIGPGTRIIRF